MSTAKPLQWRKPTDHPQDNDEALWMADGIGGCYSIGPKEDDGILLWWAHDEFIWEKCASVAEAKAKAETDWQARFAALSAATALSQAEGGQSWQSIDTAPKNGRDILCIGSWYQFPAMLRWDRGEWRDWNSNILHPTHWFTLPELGALPTRPREQASWRCFHCDEVFTTVASATTHFGEHQEFAPICQIGVVKIREMEDQLERYRAEDSDIQREMYRMQADHRQALIREEERGYAKGVADACAEARPREQEGTEPVAKEQVIEECSSHWEDLFRGYNERLGVIRISRGPEGLDFAVGGEMKWVSWRHPAPLPAASFQAGAVAMREACERFVFDCIKDECSPAYIYYQIKALPLPIPASSEGR